MKLSTEKGENQVNFLAIDTADRYLTVTVKKNKEYFSTFLPDCAMKHSVSLMEAVEKTLSQADMRLEDCDFFAAVVGAGSFTGIRIAISAVKGFCLALKKPSLAVTSFDLAAYNRVNGEKLLCLVDALHDCYYACGYEKGEVSYAPAYLTEEEVLALAKDGFTLCACSPIPLAEKADVKIVDPVIGLQKAVTALSEKNKFGALEALYVRKSSAELNQK